jgi:predicted permease
MVADFYFALTITAPIFTILGLGIVFKRIGLITEDFAKVGAELVFKVTLPCLLFVKLVETDFRHDLPIALIIYAVGSTIAVFIVLDRLIARWITTATDRGVFVQGAFRGNMGIIGLAFCLSAFGDSVVAVASIYLAFLTTLFNVLSVITLTRHQNRTVDPAHKWRVILEIGKNPLIIAIVIGVLVSLSRLPVPALLLTTGEYFARMTLPLALLCAGASIRLLEFKGDRALYWASAGKLLFVPLVITTGGALIGLQGQELGVLYLMSTSPTAAASYPMALSLGGNHHLAAAIIAMTSLGSVFFITAGIFVLRSLGLI